MWDMIRAKFGTRFAIRFGTNLGQDFGQDLGQNLGQDLGQDFGHERRLQPSRLLRHSKGNLSVLKDSEHRLLNHKKRKEKKHTHNHVSFGLPSLLCYMSAETKESVFSKKGPPGPLFSWCYFVEFSGFLENFADFSANRAFFAANFTEFCRNCGKLEREMFSFSPFPGKNSAFFCKIQKLPAILRHFLQFRQNSVKFSMKNIIF